MKDVKTELNKVLDDAMIEFKRLAGELLVYQFDDNIHEQAINTAIKLASLYRDLLPLKDLISDRYPEYNSLCVMISYVNLSYHSLRKAQYELERDTTNLAREVKRVFNNE